MTAPARSSASTPPKSGRWLAAIVVFVCTALLVSVFLVAGGRRSMPSVPTSPSSEHSDGAPALVALEDVTERAEDSRASVATEPVAPRAEPASVAAPKRAREFATLRVLVRARETGLPVPGVRVLGTRSTTSFSGGHTDASVGRVGEFLLADADGRVSITAAADEILAVIITDEAGTVAKIEVDPPLAAHETREIVAVVSTQPDLPVCVRAIDPETQLPLVDAVVSIGGDLDGQDAVDSVETDAEGIACFGLRTWSGEPIFVRAEGRATACIHAGRARERSDPLLVPLARSAAVTIRAYDGSGAPRAGMRLELVIGDGGACKFEACEKPRPLRFPSSPTWDAVTGADGSVRIADLPPGIALAGTAWPVPGEPWRAPEAIVLKPAEERVVEWRAGSACALHGRAVEADGSPAQGISIALETADLVGGSYFDSYGSEDRRHAKTDDAGRFSFDDVAAGAWIVGPAPAGESSSAPPPFAPFGQRVEIERDVARVDVVVRVERGGTITGTALDSDGKPLSDGWVSCSAIDEHAHEVANLYGDSGHFELGPLRSGEYELRAGGGDSAKGAPSEPVRVRVGGPPVELRLSVASRIRGRVLDAATREPVAAVVLLNLERSDPLRMAGQEQTEDGSFEFPRLNAGIYVVAARSSDGRYGASASVAVIAGQTLDDVEVLLQPGGRVRLKLDGLGEETVLMLVREGWTFSFDFVENGLDVEIPAPAGRITVRLWDVATRANRDVEIDLTAGELRSLTFDGAWK